MFLVLLFRTVQLLLDLAVVLVPYCLVVLLEVVPRVEWVLPKVLGGSSLGSDSEISLGGIGTAAGVGEVSAGVGSPDGASDAGGGAAGCPGSPSGVGLSADASGGAMDSRGRCLGGAIS